MLFDIEDNLISREISNVLPDLDIIKVKNRLIDGTYHSQTIGQPIKILNITCNMSESGKIVMDNAYISDKPLKLKWYGKYYIGLIFDKPSWTIHVKGNDFKRLYEAQFNIAVSEEGVI